MSRKTLNLDSTLYDYLISQSLRETPIQSRLREETAALGGPAGMQVSPEQGQFLAFLASLIGAKRVVEVGTFTGYSALSVALAVPADGRITCCDVSAEWTAIAQRYWEQAGVAGKIELRLAPALETLDALVSEEGVDKVDMAFIDADKENYDSYYESCLTLVRPGGLIAIDNVLWGGAVADPANKSADTEAIRALNAKLKEDRRVDLSLLPIGDGLTLCRKR
ncbi:MAG: class I SAM-dependent methyltransferase [Alphaproteobacteria bacterium]|nr:class I SAM-dependent methyltransferase [Alphaproteobacteria bacterium]MBO6863273.1 class I SAM-dependent methyltransferase [Alphaproteobacteria bacterium]